MEKKIQIQKMNKKNYGFTNLAVKTDTKNVFSDLCKKENKSASEMVSELIEKYKKFSHIKEGGEKALTAFCKKEEILHDYLVVKESEIEKELNIFSDELFIMKKDKNEIFINDKALLLYLFSTHTRYLQIMGAFSSLKDLIESYFPGLVSGKNKYKKWDLARKIPRIVDDLFLSEGENSTALTSNLQKLGEFVLNSKIDSSEIESYFEFLEKKKDE